MTPTELSKLIPDEVVEAATRKIAKMRGCDKAVFSKCVSAIEAGVPCKCEDEARAAIAAALAAWPGAEYCSLIVLSDRDFCGLSSPLHRRRTAMTEWQPISTAPKDGTLVIALTPAPQFVRWWTDLDGYGKDYPWVGRDGSAYRVSHVTHWMPLPSHPRRKEQRNE